ncbi:MAG: DUF4118 domain-containing protein [Eubacterium sp.]|nr:DUF4118 domain-containing protein [Eubacterium sp.]
MRHIRNDAKSQPAKIRPDRIRAAWYDFLKSIFFLAAATGLGLVFYSFHFTNANIIMVYILGALLTSIATSHQIYSLVSSIASVFVYNYLFTEPRYTMLAHETGYPVTFIVMFLTAYITGSFSLRYKKQAGQSAKIAHRTSILFDTSQLLSKADGRQEIMDTAARQIIKLLNRDIILYEYTDGVLSEPRLFQIDNKDTDMSIQEENGQEESIGQEPGESIEDYIDYNKLIAGYHYYKLHINDRIYGLVGINAKDEPLDESEHEMLLSILGECALALENEKNAREKEAAAILAENEQLRANLLRTISHDLRTPLTTISGNASNLLSNGEIFTEEVRRQIYQDIYNDSMWLYDLVENLLYSTRIEEGRMTLHASSELLGDIIDEAIAHFDRKSNKHIITADYEDELILVRADARLLVQVVINIIDNAVKYTPEGTAIHISTKKGGDMAEVLIADTGQGIPDEEKAKVFDKFYHGAGQIADSRRSIGLGLYLCKSIVEAHKGVISVSDNEPTGAVFRFTIPLQEVSCSD